MTAYEVEKLCVRAEAVESMNACSSSSACRN